MKKIFRIVGVIASATIGSGVFALPYVFQQSGWLVSLMYFIALIAVIALAHTLYLKTLETVGERKRLLGLARECFGGAGFWIGFLVIVIGLLLGFVAYLVLGSQFIRIVIPSIPPAFALALFWLMFAILVSISEGNVAWLEVTGVSLVFCAILFIFVTSNPLRAFIGAPAVNVKNLLLPFGASLFALAGWTSVEQVYEIRKKSGGTGSPFLLFVLGTAFAGLLYWLFAAGILGSAQYVTVDAISGIGNWPFWKRSILAAIGLLALGVISVPISREIRNALEKDLKWNSFVSRFAIIALPLAAILLGLRNFLVIVSLAGGIFISAQYLLIILVGRRMLQLSSTKKILLDILTAVFVGAAIYESVSFIVK